MEDYKVDPIKQTIAACQISGLLNKLNDALDVAREQNLFVLIEYDHIAKHYHLQEIEVKENKS